ncbi:MAG: ankyrin repeat domain-containing protein [Wolbachia endosymbiont of Fragariocoptes setiger]|nr:ankyrin repeat domain-containing protein [Wolbachia endosymbiont of Fragariocoptes setiger]
MTESYYFMETNKNENITLFVKSAERGDLESVKLFVERDKIDVNSKSLDNDTALHKASWNGHIKIVQYLISQGADVNIEPISGYPVTPLVCAVWKGHVEVAEFLIQNGAHSDVTLEGRDLLDKAVLSNNPEMIDLLLKKYGYDFNRYGPKGLTPLIIAFQASKYESACFLLNKGADYRKFSAQDNLSPLHYISSYVKDNSDCSRLVKLLLNHIQKVEGKERTIDYINHVETFDDTFCDTFGGSPRKYTALHMACSFENYAAVKLLLEYGADPNIKDSEGKVPEQLLDDCSQDHVSQMIKSLFQSSNNRQYSR